MSSPRCLSLREMCYPHFTGKETGRERKWLAPWSCSWESAELGLEPRTVAPGPHGFRHKPASSLDTLGPHHHHLAIQGPKTEPSWSSNEAQTASDPGCPAPRGLRAAVGRTRCLFSSQMLLLLHEPLETTMSPRLVLGPSPKCGLPGEARGQCWLQGVSEGSGLSLEDTGGCCGHG